MVVDWLPKIIGTTINSAYSSETSSNITSCAITVTAVRRDQLTLYFTCILDDDNDSCTAEIENSCIRDELYFSRLIYLYGAPIMHCVNSNQSAKATWNFWSPNIPMVRPFRILRQIHGAEPLYLTKDATIICNDSDLQRARKLVNRGRGKER
ncbi:hypothetical protein MMC22_000203 [Lobaria immixta]|nr:hypothetical protein [Lobaria immixta]